jgi:hypothetical protein
MDIAYQVTKQRGVPKSGYGQNERPFPLSAIAEFEEADGVRTVIFNK